MTLKEKLQQQKIYINPYDFKLTKESVENFEQIADDYAIDFAEWVEYSCWKVESDKYLYEDDQLTTRELLEIYKKEKGL